jgi:hypothetical protein
MQKFKRLIASFMMALSLLAITPVVAHAEWKSDTTGWWYTNGNLWDTGWNYIDGNWYYFYSDGYMAHDTYVGNYYLRSDGAWTTTPLASNTSSSKNTNSVANSSTTTINDLAKGDRTVYWTSGGKSYHYDKNCKTLARSKNIEEGSASSCPKTDPCDVCVK